MRKFYVEFSNRYYYDDFFITDSIIIIFILGESAFWPLQ